MLSETYSTRRKKLFTKLDENSIAIIAAAPEVVRNGDTTYRFRQNSDFYYLTGFNEPEAVAVFITGSSNNKGTGLFILFNRPHDAVSELWQGAFAGVEGACRDYGADQAFPISEIDQILPEYLSQAHKVYYNIGREQSFDVRVMSWLNHIRAKVRTGITAPDTFVDLEHIVHEMRLIKDNMEITIMREAAQITVQGHRRAMQACRPGMMEYELEAELLYSFIRHGSLTPAYPSIVGGGKNGCVLHYTANNAPLNDGELVLIDAGCEYQNYASDVTRTFPINGRFSKEQRQLYDIVLRAQLAGINAVRPGVEWPQIQTTIVQIITEGLYDLGILRGDIDKLITERAYYPFYMHNSGHWLGLDTHDVGSYRVNNQWRTLLPGMILTVEPGIYIAEHNPDVDAKWWNIGIRIEDDVVVTQDGCEVLTAGVPKTVSEIEALMG